MRTKIDLTGEVSSLSAITTIASNPPPHPGISARTLDQPLVLYIARVPGSRDVFLTPQKPREKVVTSHDVQGSLYYVHVNAEDDGMVREGQKHISAAFEKPRPALSDRKPLEVAPPLPARRLSPVSPPYPVDNCMPGFTGGPVMAPQPGRIARKPVLSDQAPAVPMHLDLPRIPPRPLPTPPPDESRRFSLHNENMRLLKTAEHSPDNNPYFRSYADQPAVVADNPDYTPGSLTLIRRDTTSNEQWNVATIHDPLVLEISSSTLLSPGSARRTKRGGAPLYLDITNPGYSQFNDTHRPDSRLSSSTHSSSETSEPAPEGTFRRRLYMPGSRYAEHAYGHHRKHPSVDSRGSDDMRRTLRDQLSFDPTYNANATNNYNSSSSSSPAVDTRKHYTFTSPWDGRCEFATGATGKSLKCRHKLPHQGPATEVSELRFKLPSASRSAPASVAEKRGSSYFSRHTRHLSSSGGGGGGGDDADDTNDGGSGGSGMLSPTFLLDDQGRVDLTLGREKAGGGVGGKQAKLGKLIVAVEGLPMLDLLVAANVGLWWRAYERV
ncbi:hypothetical protein LTR53_005311 [Teratosphaeriaceae sp. CCFEE 6253]|nr:hypothetical protein LTR53_005311 [Teratosphaeriaceae sp. CCFEE 6253]